MAFAPRSPGVLTTPSPSDPGSATAENQSTQIDQVNDLIAAVEANSDIDLNPATITALQTAFTSALGTTNTELSSIGDSLSDIYTELLQKLEEGEDIGLSQDTMDALGLAIATLFNYPTDYPDAAVHADLGAAGTAAPFGTGVIGWLRGIYDKLANELTVGGSATDGTALAGSPVRVGGTDGTNIRTLATDSSGNLKLLGLGTTADGTDNANAIKTRSLLQGYNGSSWDRLRTIATGLLGVGITNGTQTADTIAQDTGLNSLVTSPAVKVVSFTTGVTNANLVKQDARGYTFAVVRLNSIGSGSTCTPQVSDDDTTYLQAHGFSTVATALNSTGATIGTLIPASTSLIYVFPIQLKWFRLNLSALSSGTFAGTVEFHTSPSPIPNFVQVDTELPAAVTLGDAVANPSAPTVGALGLVWDAAGSQWVRARSAIASADGITASGLGSLATVGLNYGYNGSTWDRLRAGASAVSALGKLNVMVNTSTSIVLNGVTTTQASGSQDYGQGVSKASMQVTLTGSPATCIVVLEGSLNGTVWETLTTWDLATLTSGRVVFSQDKLVRYLRANLTTLTGGTSPTVTALVLAGVG